MSPDAFLHPNTAEQLKAALTLLDRHLADTMQACYLYGSATADGLQAHSDLDLMVVVNRTLTETERKALSLDLLSISVPRAEGGWRPLEVTVVCIQEVVPWRYPPCRELQFGEWLRDELLAGKVAPAVNDPDLAILITLVRQNGMALKGIDAEQLFAPVPQEDVYRAIRDILPDVVNGWDEDERHTVLALSRMWATLQTGRIMSKNAAADRLRPQVPEMYQPLLQLAADAYLGKVQDDWKSVRTLLKSFVDYAQKQIGHMAPA